MCPEPKCCAHIAAFTVGITAQKHKHSNTLHKHSLGLCSSPHPLLLSPYSHPFRPHCTYSCPIFFPPHRSVCSTVILSPFPLLSVVSSWSSVKDVPVFRVTVIPSVALLTFNLLYDWGQRLSPWCLTSPREAILVHGYCVQFKHASRPYL